MKGIARELGEKNITLKPDSKPVNQGPYDGIDYINRR
jgi:hypothetical protein